MVDDPPPPRRFHVLVRAALVAGIVVLVLAAGYVVGFATLVLGMGRGSFGRAEWDTVEALLTPAVYGWPVSALVAIGTAGWAAAANGRPALYAAAAGIAALPAFLALAAILSL